MKNKIAALLVIAAVLFSLNCRAEIYRCEDADGNLMFTQLPCAENVPPVVEQQEMADEIIDEETAPPLDEPVEIPDEPHDVEAIAKCKKPYRDAIDAIDLQMREGYTADQGDAFKEELRGLTRQLRRCEAQKKAGPEGPALDVLKS